MSQTMPLTGSGKAVFHDPAQWADMDAWHRDVGDMRRNEGIVHVDEPGYSPYWAILKHADAFAVSRDNAGWLNTANSVLGPDADWEQLVASGMPPPCSLVQLDGTKHRDHRKVTNDWFKPAVVGKRQPRIDELTDLFIERMRELGGQCDFAKDIAQPYTLRVIMDIYGVPEEDEALTLELTQGIFGASDPEFLGDAADPGVRATQSIMQFIQYFNEITVDRRALPHGRPRHRHRQRHHRRRAHGRLRAALVLHHRRHGGARHDVVRAGRRDGALHQRPVAAVGPARRARPRQTTPPRRSSATRRRCGTSCGGRPTTRPSAVSTSPRAAGC